MSYEIDKSFNKDIESVIARCVNRQRNISINADDEQLTEKLSEVFEDTAPISFKEKMNSEHELVKKLWLGHIRKYLGLQELSTAEYIDKQIIKQMVEFARKNTPVVRGPFDSLRPQILERIKYLNENLQKVSDKEMKDLPLIKPTYEQDLTQLALENFEIAFEKAVCQTFAVGVDPYGFDESDPVQSVSSIVVWKDKKSIGYGLSDEDSALFYEPPSTPWNNAFTGFKDPCKTLKIPPMPDIDKPLIYVELPRGTKEVKGIFQQLEEGDTIEWKSTYIQNLSSVQELNLTLHKLHIRITQLEHEIQTLKANQQNEQYKTSAKGKDSTTTL